MKSNEKKAFRDIIRATVNAEIATVNRAAKSAFSQTSKFIRATYNIKKSDLDKNAKISKATKSNPHLTLTIYCKAISLYKFRGGKAKKGARATIRKGSRKEYKGTFVAPMPNGHTGIFKRVSKERLPIKELYGPSGMQLFGSDESFAYIRKVYRIEFEKQIQANLKYYINKLL